MDKKEKYFYWNKKVGVEKYTLLRSFLHIQGEKKSLFINKTGEEIILAFDGTRTYEYIVRSLAHKYDDETENVEGIILDFLNELKKYGIELEQSTKKHPIDILVAGEDFFYPKVASLELTEKCNIKCLHCYGNFHSDLNNEMPLDKAKKLLLDLSQVGVQVIELTGGDITMYPYIIELIKYAIELPFQKIDLLTNGVAISDALMQLIIANREKIYVQIDIHSLNDDYLRWFTQAKVSSKQICNNVEKLVESGVNLRIATVFTSGNLAEIFSIADYVNSLGQIWGITPVEPLGRADYSNAPLGLLLNSKESKILFKNIEEIKKKYPKLLPEMKEGERANEYNCGIMTNHIVINACGQIKICTMDNLSYGMDSIGNVFEEDIKQIFDREKELILSLSVQQVPTFESVECEHCEHRMECVGCLLRTFINVKKMRHKCAWYTRNINTAIEKKWLEE